MKPYRDIITSYKTIKYRSYFTGDMQYKVQFFDKAGYYGMMFVYHYDKQRKLFVYHEYTTKTHKAMIKVLCNILSSNMGYTLEIEVK